MQTITKGQLLIYRTLGKFHYFTTCFSLEDSYNFNRTMGRTTHSTFVIVRLPFPRPIWEKELASFTESACLFLMEYNQVGRFWEQTNCTALSHPCRLFPPNDSI